MKPYIKPELVRRDKLTQIAASNGPIVVSGGFV